MGLFLHPPEDLHSDWLPFFQHNSTSRLLLLCCQRHSLNIYNWSENRSNTHTPSALLISPETGWPWQATIKHTVTYRRSKNSNWLVSDDHLLFSISHSFPWIPTTLDINLVSCSCYHEQKDGFKFNSNAVSERHSGNTLKSLVLKLSNQETLKYFNFYNHFSAPGPFVLNEDINV